MNDRDTDALMRLVNENSDYYKIGEYITNKFNINLDVVESKKYAKSLLANFSKNDILNGKADYIISFELNSKIQRQEQVKYEQTKREEIKTVPLKTTKTKINKTVIISIIAAMATVTTLYGAVIKPTYDEIKENNEIRQTIGMMVAEVGSDDYNYKRGIVSQNTYQVGFNNDGEPLVAYHNDGIAKDIIKVCTEDPELFELCVYNVYYDMNHYRLKNMDEVVKWLKIYSKDDESLDFIQDKLFNCQVFLDYLVSRGFADPNSKDYYQLLEDIEMYKDVGYSNLSKESIKRINKLTDEFKENRDNLYAEYKSNLEEKGDSYGTRS